MRNTFSSKDFVTYLLSEYILYKYYISKIYVDKQFKAMTA